MVVVSHKVAKDTMVVDDAKLVNNYMMDDTQGMDMDISRCSKIGKGGEQHHCFVVDYIKVINTKVVEVFMLLVQIEDSKVVKNTIEETMMVDDIMVDHPKVVSQAGPIGTKLAEIAGLFGKVT